MIFADNVISVANYSLVDKKFNFSWGGTYSLNKKNIQLSYEWHSQDSLLVNTTAELSLVIKKNGHLSIGKLLSDLKKLDYTGFKKISKSKVAFCNVSSTRIQLIKSTF